MVHHRARTRTHYTQTYKSVRGGTKTQHSGAHCQWPHGGARAHARTSSRTWHVRTSRARECRMDGMAWDSTGANAENERVLLHCFESHAHAPDERRHKKSDGIFMLYARADVIYSANITMGVRAMLV